MKQRSWKTTLGGLLIASAPIVATAVSDDWKWIGAAMLSIGGLFMTRARDNDKTSEQVGAGK